MSFDLFAYRELKDTAADCEDRYHQLERLMRCSDARSAERYHEKQSEAFIGQTEGFLASLEDALLDFKDVEFREMKLTEEELIRLFYFKFKETPLLARMDAVMEYFIDAYETLHGRSLSDEERERLQGKFDQMYVTKDIYEIYNMLMEECGYPKLPKASYEKRLIEYEDVFPMLYLKYRLKGTKAHKHIKHLVIDEMQDYSYLQYVILQNLFSCRMTILGDRAQTLDEKPHDVLAFLPRIFGKGIRKIVMDKSYRNTVEIADYAARISGIEGTELLNRHGKPVEEQTFSKAEEMLDAICENLNLGENEENSANAARSSEGYETAAVLTMTEGETIAIYRLLKNRGIEASYVDRDSSLFKKGLTVTTFYLAKGLEFDQVFEIQGDKENPLLGQAAYICATRALHELYVYCLEG